MCRAVVLQEESGKWVRDLECSVETIFKMDLPIPLPETVRVTGEQVETACHVLNLQVVYTDSPPSLVPCETRGTTDFWASSWWGGWATVPHAFFHELIKTLQLWTISIPMF